jgi:hypothetical protein
VETSHWTKAIDVLQAAQIAMRAIAPITMTRWQAAEKQQPGCVVVFGRTERNDHIPAPGLLS